MDEDALDKGIDVNGSIGCGLTLMRLKCIVCM
jgi:hypothetical protein